MADNRDVFKAMLPLRDVHDSQSGKLALRWDEDAQFDEYLRLLAKDGTWGGELEILAAAEYFGVTIVVRQDNGRFLSYNDDIGGIPAHIGYSRQQLHYYSQETMTKPFVMVQIAIWTPSIPKLLSATTNVLKASSMMTLISMI
jgi:OTU-like cysteine protease